MRTHTFSVAVSALDTGDWTVAIVQTTLRGGRVVDQRITDGPVWLPEERLQEFVSRALTRLQQHVREEQAQQPAHQ